MSKGWLILAIVLAILAGAITWISARGPLYRLPPDAGEPRSFSPNSQFLVTVEQQSRPVLVYRWGARTGNLYDRIELPCPHPRNGALAHVSQAGSLALLDQAALDEADGCWRGWSLHERWTGRRLQTLPSTFVTANPFSPDDRWFIGFHRLVEVAIHSAETGQLVRAVPGIDQRKVLRLQVFFAPDSGSVAVPWTVADPADNTTPDIVQILESPSGRELRRFVMPRRGGFDVKRWDGQRLIVAETFMDETTDQEVVKGWVFDATGQEDQPTHDPLLWASMACTLMPGIILWQDGPGWVAYTSVHIESKQEHVLQLCKDWLSKRTSMRFRDAPQFDISMLDRSTGKKRFVAAVADADRILFSDDGKLMAHTTHDNHIEVWDTDPPSRLPAAIGVGVVVGGCVLAFGRWRTVRKRRKSQPTQSQPTPMSGTC